MTRGSATVLLARTVRSVQPDKRRRLPGSQLGKARPPQIAGSTIAPAGLAVRAIDPRLPKTAQVYESIRAAIIAMRLPPGAPIPEKEICALLGVSRTPLREAILQLATESLVVVRPSGGTFVSHILLREVLEGQITRDTLEMRLVRLAARCFAPEHAAAFDVCLFRQRLAAEARDADAFFDLDNGFHRLICEVAGFPNGWRTIHGATGQLDRVRHFAFPAEKNFDEVLDEHTRMYACIKAGDEDGAAAMFQIQLDSIFRTLTLIQERFPELIAFDSTASLRDIR